MVVPAQLDPFAEEAAPAVMTRIALDWMIEGTSIEPILDAVSEGQYTREFLLGHFVQVMCDVACGFRSSPRAAFVVVGLATVATSVALLRLVLTMPGLRAQGDAEASVLGYPSEHVDGVEAEGPG